MSTTKMMRVLRDSITRAELDAMPDAHLLQRFLASRDDGAFAALVHRHASMVWSVCVRRLRHQQDAEDAFQATFVVLFRKAATIRPPGMLANWLYGVAQQIAAKAYAMNAKRHARQRTNATIEATANVEPDCGSDLQPILDEELSRLPDKYRAVIVLCDLLGKTRSEAARQLSVPDGTVAGRLARARAMLGKRLARRGITLSSAAIGAALTEMHATAAPASIIAETVVAASGPVSANVAILANGVIHTMLLAKLRFAVLGLTIVLLTLGAGVFAAIASGDTEFEIEHERDAVIGVPANPKKAPAAVAPQQPKDADAARTDRDKLQGDWAVAEQPFVPAQTWTFLGTLIKQGADDQFVRTFTLRPDTLPKQIDITVQPSGDGPILLQMVGIYAFEGETLKIIVRHGNQRPTAFENPLDPGKPLILTRIDPRKVEAPVPRLRPIRFIEGSGYEWHGVFATDDGKTRVYLCNPAKLTERIELKDTWAKTVLKDWDTYRDRIVEGYSWKDEEPLDYRLLLDKKAQKKPALTPEDIQKALMGFPRRTYDGPSESFLIEGKKRTPIDQVDFRKLKGPTTIEFTGGSAASIIEFSPGGGIVLSSYWEHPARIRFRINGRDRLQMPGKGMGGDDFLRGQRLQITTETPSLSIVMGKGVQVEFLGADQTFLAGMSELKKLNGEWKSTQGTPASLRIEYDQVVNENGTVLRLDPTKNPKEMTFANGSPYVNLARHAIYKLEDKQLTIAFAKYGQPRPRGFAAGEGSETITTFQKTSNESAEEIEARWKLRRSLFEGGFYQEAP